MLIERKDANKDFYGSPVPARDILGGRVPPPEIASRLYEIIEAAEVSNQFSPFQVDNTSEISEWVSFPASCFLTGIG